MKKKKRILLLALFLLAIGGLIWIVSGEREPAYQGKTLSQWMKGYEPNKDDETIDDARRREKDADNAIRHIGTNALPFLAKMFTAKDSKLKEKLMALTQRQSLIKFNFTPASDKHFLAVRGLGALGKDGAPLIPMLTRSLDDNNPETRYFAALAIARTGIAGLKTLTNALASTNQRVRSFIATVFGQYREADDGDWLVAQLSKGELAFALGRIIPILLELVKDSDIGVEFRAISSLGQIRQQPEVVVPVLINILENPLDKCRWEATRALAKFGAQARSAVPALVAALQDPDKEVRKAAGEALLKIDPGAAAKAGVK
jgi:HEAT repeat protein